MYMHIYVYVYVLKEKEAINLREIKGGCMKGIEEGKGRRKNDVIIFNF